MFIIKQYVYEQGKRSFRLIHTDGRTIWGHLEGINIVWNRDLADRFSAIERLDALEEVIRSYDLY